MWVNFAVYAYDSGRHSTVLLSPNEVMMGRCLRSPNELLRNVRVTEAGDVTHYHEQLLSALKLDTSALGNHENESNADKYDTTIEESNEVGHFSQEITSGPPRGAQASKFVHQWAGPMSVIEAVGYDNYLLEREDDGD
ncbi:LOW QUALITY PROTEIN: Hypothetical protein PHPALM_20611 [Phytophthora palmivora]|uniref:Uncharacterized protein n=1 Tax=Phytophthora palmivora TaxID=4796 RepID=A0A2P4XEF1_9STRA|nr:LOW QUALITY PROTEIN: Hypothetical protein PHPALM_20611 [Phytophthora palmivora]